MTSGDDAQVPKVGSHASVNSLQMYDEVHGTGKPLVPLHGGVGAIEMFGEVLGMLAEGRHVVGGGKADTGWDGSGMPNARLAVLPATTHYDIFSSPVLASAVTPLFLDSPMPEDQ
jgi:hypothetical protein